MAGARVRWRRFTICIYATRRRSARSRVTIDDRASVAVGSRMARDSGVAAIALLIVACGGELRGDSDASTPDAATDTSLESGGDASGDASDGCTSAALHVDV